ncbi:hypothetical protein [Heyndrickxia acidicola]|uniref:XRE family transcriptional regulator n=1 Tax=Heyndrickxia acidicola TaxID=209389 RepID=A0ABU6MD71_9BACI|nr:hypothetical protein [Heyndrickxia acidicola]MED1201981.1 XRE family transcriptional regulator [Heyndrickxia acidicola]
MRESAFVGGAIKTLQIQEELFQEQMAFDLNVSPQLISHMKNNRRKMQQDVAKQSLLTYDNPIYSMQILYEFSNGMTPPVLSGKSVERHRLAIEELAINEAREAIQILDEVSLVKPPAETNKEERERIGQVIDEISDAIMALTNLKAILGEEYNISLKQRSEKRLPVWKAKGWI